MKDDFVPIQLVMHDIQHQESSFLATGVIVYCFPSVATDLLLIEQHQYVVFLVKGRPLRERFHMSYIPFCYLATLNNTTNFTASLIPISQHNSRNITIYHMAYEIINDTMLYRVIPCAEQDFLTFTILE